ncbi:ATP-binding protein [Nonomuraea sp. NPDC002799]
MTGDRTPGYRPARSPESAARPIGHVILDERFGRESLYALRATLEAHVTQAGLPEGRTSDLVLTVHELASNVILHGSGAGRVIVRQSPHALHCQVSDTGAPAPTAAGPGEWPYEYGHGLWIARYLSDEHSVRHGPDGAIATVVFVLPQPGTPVFQLARHPQANGHVRLELIGSLDHRTADGLTGAIAALVADDVVLRLVLDLGGMTFWDSNGIAALIMAQQHVNGSPATSMVLTGLSDDFKERLEALSVVPFDYLKRP